MNEIRVIIKRPGEAAFEANVKNELETLQRWVQGHIEAYTLSTSPRVVLICNEEGAIFGMTPNCRLNGVPFVGPILLVGTRRDEFADCPYSLKTAAAIWPELRGPRAGRKKKA